MRQLVLKMSMSLDGFVVGPNGEIDWIFRSQGADAAKWLLDTLWQADVHIMGSRTFRDMAAYWPSSSEPFAAPMNEIPKVVFSRKGLPAGERAELAKGWAEAEVAGGELTEGINRLKRQPGKIILAHGGARFAQALVRSGLVDEYRLLVHPVALGNGLPLFSGLPKPIDLQLASVTAFRGGAAAHIYRVT